MSGTAPFGISTPYIYYMTFRIVKINAVDGNTISELKYDISGQTIL